MNGIKNVDYMIGMSAPWGLTKDSFTITILGRAKITWADPDEGAPTRESADADQWNVNWIAVGYIC